MVLEHQVQVGIRTVFVSLSFNALFSYRAFAAVYLSVARHHAPSIRPTETPIHGRTAMAERNTI
jgi:hypothetical protein